MRIDRTWGKYHFDTYDIRPIRNLIRQEMTDGLWLDPFGTPHSPTLVSNEFDADRSDGHNWDAVTFLKLFDDASVDGVLYNPPYDPILIKVYYAGHGFVKPSSPHGWVSLWSDCEDEIARIVKPGGKIISFGWHSTGCGRMRGFILQRILLVPHGHARNDTICTVEIKL